VDELKGKGVTLSSSNSLNVERLKLTPSATNGLFNLAFNLPSNGNTIISIFNQSGRALYEYDLGNFNGEFSDNVDISQNGHGDYFLKIEQSGKSFSQKIVLSKK
jgi:hypothetical protein